MDANSTHRVDVPPRRVAAHEGDRLDVGVVQDAVHRVMGPVHNVEDAPDSRHTSKWRWGSWILQLIWCYRRQLLTGRLCKETHTSMGVMNALVNVLHERQLLTWFNMVWEPGLESQNIK
jgi:hypothetical protein